MPVLAGRWETARFPEWSESFIDRLVTNSPWARPWKGTAVRQESTRRILSSWSQVGIGLPGQIPGVRWPRSPGQGRVPPQQQPDPVIRVAVDLTIRWASALPIRQAIALQQFGRAGLGDPRAIEMIGIEPEHFIIELAGFPRILLNEQFERDLRKARLVVPGRRPTTPLSVTVPGIGTHLTASLRFTRANGLQPEGTHIGLQIETGTLRVDEEFKLRSMIYNGHLEL